MGLGDGRFWIDLWTDFRCGMHTKVMGVLALSPLLHSAFCPVFQLSGITVTAITGGTESWSLATIVVVFRVPSNSRPLLRML